MKFLCTVASAYAHVNIPSCQRCFFWKHLCQCIRQGSAFPCILLFLSCSCAYACSELVLVCLCSQRSFVVHVRVDPSCSAVLHSSIVSRLSLPHPRLTCLWAGCGWHVAAVKAISVVTHSSLVVECRWKWAIERSGLGDHEPFSPCHLGSEVLRMSVGAHGWFVRFSRPSVQSPSWSWLPIVEAPGCLRHPISTQRRSCYFHQLLQSRIQVSGFTSPPTRLRSFFKH